MSKQQMPWESLPSVWKTKAAFMSWLRGSIRRACWMRSPIKLEVLKRKRKRITNPKTGKTRWGGECYICHNDFPQNELIVDHLEGEHSLKEISDIQNFVEAMTCLPLESFDVCCKGCHRIKTSSERYNITMSEAATRAKIADMMKDKNKVNKLLDSHSLPCNNDLARKESLRKLIEEGKV